MNGRVILATLTSALLAITASAPAQRPESASVVVEAPRWQVGDEWRYSDGRTTRVVAVEDGSFVTEDTPDPGCPGCRSVRNANWAVIAVIAKDGKRSPSPGYRDLDFPLSVGKEWKFEWRRRPESRRHRHPPGTLRIRGTTGHPQVAVGRRQSTSGDEGRARRRRAPRQSGALGFRVLSTGFPIPDARTWRRDHVLALSRREHWTA